MTGYAHDVLHALDAGPLTSAEVAEAVGLPERVAKHWLMQLSLGGDAQPFGFDTWQRSPAGAIARLAFEHPMDGEALREFFGYRGRSVAAEMEWRSLESVASVALPHDLPQIPSLDEREERDARP